MNPGNDIQDQRTKRKQWSRMTMLQRAASLMGRRTSDRKTDACRRNAQARWDAVRAKRAADELAMRQAITRATAQGAK